MLKEEAEISAYFNKDVENAEDLLHIIEQIDGVRYVRLVNEEEARSRMEKILGDESDILDLFEENPFEAYFEVKIHLDKMDPVFTQISGLKGIDYVRENRDVLEQIERISKALEVLGYLVIAAVSITTLVIISHMIRQGIYQNHEQIKTLMLLGAPDNFINFPYVLLGFLLTFGGGIVATVFINILIHQGYSMLTGTIPFIPVRKPAGIWTEYIPIIGKCCSWNTGKFIWGFHFKRKIKDYQAPVKPVHAWVFSITYL